MHRALEQHGTQRGVNADWPAVTKSWRKLSTKMVDAGLPEVDGRVGMDMDDVLAATLRTALEQHSVSGFTSDDLAQLVLAWRQMEPWPDVPTGLRSLRNRFVVSPFTILKTALVIEASRRARLSWDAVISCEMIGVDKTHRASYETAARWLDLPHERIMLVSTHNNDICAAHSFGFRTAFLYRPDEWWDIPSLDPEPSEAADVVAADLNDLARQFGLSATGSF